jgi:hypothetical protein
MLQALRQRRPDDTILDLIGLNICTHDGGVNGLSG